MDWYCFTFWFLAASASGFQVYHGLHLFTLSALVILVALPGSQYCWGPFPSGSGAFLARYLERAWTCLEHFGTTKNALAMLPVYLYLWSYLEVRPQKSQWSRNHLPVKVHFKACWSSSQNTWWILIWLAVLDMICHHRNGTIFTDLPQWQSHIFQGAKNHQSLRVFPSHFPQLSSWRWCASVAYRWAICKIILKKPTVVGVPSGCLYVSGWGSMMFHVFFGLNASWAHPARSVFPPDPSKSAASGRSKFVDEAFPAATGTTNPLWVPGFAGRPFFCLVI